MTRPRTGKERVRAVESRRPMPPRHTVAAVGGPDAMTDDAADAIAELIEIGRAVDAQRNRERRSKP